MLSNWDTEAIAQLLIEMENSCGCASKPHLTHISQHARLEIPIDLRDLRAFSPPRPASGRSGGEG